MALGAGASWVLTAQIIMDEGGIKHFGMNWGLAVTFNFLGWFMFFVLTYFLNFRSVGMGTCYLLTGILVPLFVFLAWHFDRKETKEAASKPAQNKTAPAANNGPAR
jgi:hypothetical protein